MPFILLKESEGSETQKFRKQPNLQNGQELADEENNRYITPIDTLPVNMFGRMDSGDTSTEVLKVSEVELGRDLLSISVSTFETTGST